MGKKIPTIGAIVTEEVDRWGCPNPTTQCVSREFSVFRICGGQHFVNCVKCGYVFAERNRGDTRLYPFIDGQRVRLIPTKHPRFGLPDLEAV